MKNFIYLIAAIGVHFAHAGSIVEINSSNLKDYSLTQSETRNCAFYWKTTVVVEEKTYSRSGCWNEPEGSNELASVLDEVLKSPYSEQCVVSETCWGKKCSRTYGRRQVNRVVKAIVDAGNNIVRFVSAGSTSRCER